MLKEAAAGESVQTPPYGVRQDGSGAKLQVDDEVLIADIIGAVQGLEYGAVTVSVQGGRVVQLERSEKRRLAKGAKAVSHASL